jgi:hypothetical protein
MLSVRLIAGFMLDQLIVGAFGADFVLSLPGCSRVDIPPSKVT